MRLTFEKQAIAAFVIAITSTFIYLNTAKPRILILHSYDASYPWTRDINVGIKRVIDKHRNISLQWHYMDTKRHTSEDFKRAAGISARKAVDDYRPDVVIGVDDDAHKLALHEYAGHPSISIVYAGINGNVTPYGYDNVANTTGILERKPLKAVRDAALEIARNQGIKTPVRILHIADQSESVKYDDRSMQEFNWQPTVFVGSQLVNTWAAWQQAIIAAPARADILIVSNYRLLMKSEDDADPIDYKQILPWTEAHSTLPVIGTNVFNVEDGGEFALGTSPYEQGEAAAEIAVQIIEKRLSPKLIPPHSSEQFIVAMREDVYRHRGFELSFVYEAFARATDNFISSTESTVAPVIAALDPPVNLAATTGANSNAGDAQFKEPQLEPTSGSAPTANSLTIPPIHHLIFKAASKTQIEVRDPVGVIQLCRTLNAGQTQQLDISFPAQIHLDKTRGVAITRDGTPISPPREKNFVLQ